MWRFVGNLEQHEPLPGVPAVDMTDEEFAEYEALYDSQFEKGGLRGSGLYEHSGKDRPSADVPASQEVSGDGND